MPKYEPVGSYKYKCVCEICGKEFYEKAYRKNIAKYCSWKCANSRGVNDLMGKKFGRLQVISFDGIKHRYAYWKCLCDCGNITIVRGSHLIDGTTISCGCYQKELSAKRIKDFATKHDLSSSRLYKVYTSIKSRCYCKNQGMYDNYGGRGIKMCDEWKNDFMAFHDWAYANGYDENAELMKCTIDRINNDGDYEPSNCRWVSMKEQNLNKRTNHRVEYNGKSYTVKEISQIKKCSYGAILWRLNNGWSAKDTFEIPIDNIHFNPRNNKKKLKYNANN